MDYNGNGTPFTSTSRTMAITEEVAIYHSIRIAGINGSLARHMEDDSAHAANENE